MIQIRNLSKTYIQADGTKTPVLRNISLNIGKGEVISIIGPSGTGKSTLLRCLNGLEKIDSGQIVMEGIRVGMVFQNFNLFSHLTILQNLTIAPMKLLRLSRHEAEKEAMELLRLVGVADKANVMPDSLSGGQKQRVAIARCLAMHPECILFDEPTSALDPTMVSEVLSVIRHLATQGMTMLIVTHEMQFARNVSSRVLFLSDGNILEDDSPDQVFNNPQHQQTRDFLQRNRRLHYELASYDSDPYGVYPELNAFCMKFGISHYNFCLNLLFEEIIFVLAKDYRPLHIDITFSEQSYTLIVKITASGAKKYLVGDAANELSVKLVEGICENIKEEVTPDGATFEARCKKIS